MKKIRGFTLIELLITILIMSILASVAGPSFLDSFDKRKVISAGEELYSNLQLARSESLTRSETIFLTVANKGTTTWMYGLSADAACNPTITSNTNSGSCVLTIDDGDGVDTAANDDVLFRVDGSDYDDVSMTFTVVSGVTGTSMSFDPARGTTDSARNFVFTSGLGKTLTVKVSLLGTVKMCSNDLGGYKGCS